MTKRAKIPAAAKGEYVSKTLPYGYDAVKVDRRNSLAPNANAQYVMLIFRLYAEGAKLRDIVRELNSVGAPTATGSIWRPGTLRSILANPVYAGKIRWKDAVYDGIHEPIVSDELFDAAQARLNRSRQDR